MNIYIYIYKYWTASTNRSCKCFQELFLQLFPVRVTVNGFTVKGDC